MQVMCMHLVYVKFKPHINTILSDSLILKKKNAKGITSFSIWSLQVGVVMNVISEFKLPQSAAII